MKKPWEEPIRYSHESEPSADATEPEGVPDDDQDELLQERDYDAVHAAHAATDDDDSDVISDYDDEDTDS